MSNKAPSGFQYTRPRAIIRSHWADGKWHDIEVLEDDHLPLSLAATALHYGQSAFEGLKAFQQPDQSICLFRPLENAKRLRQSCERLCMPLVTDELFMEGLSRAIKENQSLIPDHQSGGSLYVRPFVFGSGPTIGVRPSDTYEFIVIVIPVGNYYSNESGEGAKSIISESFDRAAPLGMGNVKAAGNYASDLLPTKLAKQQGFNLVLYLDAKTRSRIEEFGTSNFVGIDAQGTYVTPDSATILPSITNKSLIQLCEHLGVKAERRPILLDDLSQFVEIGACGTAVVITPVDEIHHKGSIIWKNPSGSNSKLEELLKRLQLIQKGLAEDPFHWRYPVEI